MQHFESVHDDLAASEDGRLALHVRRRRQWYRGRPLAQAELAALAGLSSRQVRAFERCRKLPAAVDTLLSIAVALEISLEELIAPHIVAAKAEAIERRRDSAASGSSTMSEDATDTS